MSSKCSMPLIKLFCTCKPTSLSRFPLTCYCSNHEYSPMQGYKKPFLVLPVRSILRSGVYKDVAVPTCKPTRLSCQVRHSTPKIDSLVHMQLSAKSLLCLITWCTSTLLSPCMNQQAHSGHVPVSQTQLVKEFKYHPWNPKYRLLCHSEGQIGYAQASFQQACHCCTSYSFHLPVTTFKPLSSPLHAFMHKCLLYGPD